MKRNGFQLWNIGKWRAKLLHILSMGRTFVLLVVGSLLFFLLLGLGGMAEKKINDSPVSSMKGFAGSVSSNFFIDMLGMELPHLNKEKGNSTFSGENMTTFVFQMLTSVNPRDPKSLLAREMPGMGANDPVLLRHSAGNDNVVPPEDYNPPAETAGQTDTAGQSDTAPADPQKNGAEQGGTDPGKDTGSGTAQQPDAPPVQEPDAGGKKGSGEGTPAKGNEGSGQTSPANSKDKAILIYHSHPREAYNPLLSKTSDNPSSTSPSQNVMLVGSYVTKKLEQLGIATAHSEQDYMTTVTDYNYNFSYKYSRETVKAAMSGNSSMKYLIDIHRDSQGHSRTTKDINGKSYAQVFFIIGHGNKNWRKNEAFANSIHERLEKAYPGLSRGIWGKDSSMGNGEYNQSLSENSILIEVGGIDSTDTELKRTSEVLAQTIADVYYADQKAEKASTDQTAPAKKDNKS
ncbi:stage II sporulation protein P [Paenibacillus sp. XY044]|uniref:stage II sporulation protein P n=1 Tax=Paenibacillus sp. XY044 TaxID=2026089 RepID=UPI000B99BE66|nr:stage II sporulation protein P [Paenibacillus sp. XY044]OZB91644.1 stage II sporulation protein P [Paenibacillus sp. XY044]